MGSNHGTLQGGAGYTVGRIGPGFNFSNPLPAGTRNQYVLVPDDPSLRITNQMTMSAWVYPTGPGTGPAPFEGQPSEGGIIINKEFAYEIARFSDGSIRWAFGNGVNSFAPLPYWVNSGGTAPLNTWTHVAVTYSNGTVTTYINGAPVSTISPPGIVLGAGTHTLRIGGRELYPGGANFDGSIDEVGIQNRALTLAEVQALYNAALPQATASVSISNVNAIFDGMAKPVTVTSSVPAVTLYNASTTAPSAIGAYFVQGIALPNGYAGAASVIHKIASTLPAGGNGGAPYPASGALGCGPGVVANGVRPSTNGYYGLVGVQLLCGDGNHPPAVAGPPSLDWSPTVYQATSVTCGVGEVMVGLHGQTGAPFGFPVVERLGPQCQSTSGGAITDAGPLGGAGGGYYPDTPFSLTCNPGQAVTGVVGGVGEVVDSIALVCAPLTATPTITSASPSTGGAGQGFVVLRGMNLPSPSGATATVTNGVTTASGFVFESPSTTSAYWVRLPAGFPTGAATITLANGAVVTNAFPITVSATPGVPVITNILDGNFAPTGVVFSGLTIYVQADGIDTLGSVVRFQQGASISDVASGTAVSSASIGLVVTIAAPSGLVPGPVLVSIRQGASAFSTPVTLNVPAP